MYYIIFIIYAFIRLHARAILSLHMQCYACLYNDFYLVAFILQCMNKQDNESHKHALSALRKSKDQVRCLMHRIPSPSSNPLFIEVHILCIYSVYVYAAFILTADAVCVC